MMPSTVHEGGELAMKVLFCFYSVEVNMRAKDGTMTRLKSVYNAYIWAIFASVIFVLLTLWLGVLAFNKPIEANRYQPFMQLFGTIAAACVAVTLVLFRLDQMAKHEARKDRYAAQAFILHMQDFIRKQHLWMMDIGDSLNATDLSDAKYNIPKENIIISQYNSDSAKEMPIKYFVWVSQRHYKRFFTTWSDFFRCPNDDDSKELWAIHKVLELEFQMLKHCWYDDWHKWDDNRPEAIEVLENLRAYSFYLCLLQSIAGEFCKHLARDQDPEMLRLSMELKAGYPFDSLPHAFKLNEHLKSHRDLSKKAKATALQQIDELARGKIRDHINCNPRGAA
ncbi:MAG: hypothetical protein Alpg2KO_04840 [Alphaproteobacteria bacterium]